MSLRTKASEIREAGASERGNFTPTGAPLRLYNYWLQRTRSERGRLIRRGERAENFCHFWRVVAIWAPLMYVLKALDQFFGSPKTWIGIGIAALFGLVFLGVTVSEVGIILLEVVGILLTVAWGTLGIASGWSLTMESDEVRERRDVPKRKTAIVGSIVSPVFAGVTWLFIQIKSRWTRKATDIVGISGTVVIGLAVLSLLVYTAVTTPMGFLVGVLITLGIGLAVLALIVGFSLLADFIQGRRKIARDKRLAKQEAEALNPKPRKVVEPRESGKVDKFFTGLADFIVLIAQIVRVKKWKICPIVEVDTSR